MIGKLSIIILSAFISCGQGTSADPRALTRTIPVQDSIAGSVHHNKEYIDLSAVRINGELPWITTPGALYGLLGQPDSIVPVNSDEGCGYYFSDDDPKIVHLKGIQAQILRDSAVINMIRFRDRSEIFLKTPRMILSYQTALSDLSRLFPQAFKEQEVLDVDGIGKAICIRLETSDQPREDAWLLFFQKGKLVRMDHWNAC